MGTVLLLRLFQGSPQSSCSQKLVYILPLCPKLEPHPYFIVKLDLRHCPSFLTSCTMPFLNICSSANTLPNKLNPSLIFLSRCPTPWTWGCFSVHLLYSFVFNAYMCLLPNPHGPNKKALFMYYSSSPTNNTIQMSICWLFKHLYVLLWCVCVCACTCVLLFELHGMVSNKLH